MENPPNNLTPESTGDDKEPLLPHYVYLLLDPLDGNKPFYVGKGMGSRVSSHTNEVKSFLKKLLENEEDIDINIEEVSFKRSKISRILKSNSNPIEVIIGRFETAEEAFAVESVYIHHFIGYENLTNIASGHGSKYIRTKFQMDEIKNSDFSSKTKHDQLIPSIDVPTKKSGRDGTYRDKKIQALNEAGAYDFLSELQIKLTESDFSWRDFNEEGDMRHHPSESNGYLAVIVRIKDLDFNIQFTKTKTIALQLIYTERTKSKLGAPVIENLKENPHKISENIEVKPMKANYKYSWININNRENKYNKIQDALDALKSIQESVI